MAEHFDLLVRGGLLIDGTGAPARPGDLGIRGGRIAAAGTVQGTADRVLVETPRKLSPRQRELLEEFARISGEEVHPLSKSFLEKVKSMLG